MILKSIEGLKDELRLLRAEKQEREYIERHQRDERTRRDVAHIVKWLDEVLRVALKPDGEVTSVFGAIEGEALRLGTKHGQFQITVTRHP